MKLHIGGVVRSAGWSTLNIVPGPEIDFVGDCRSLAQFADGSVEAIYASHVLEHLAYSNALVPALNDWFRVLMPGGTVMISVPDLAALCRLFLDPRLDLNGRVFIMRMIFGGQADEYDYHYVGFDWHILSAYLTDAGFRDVSRVADFGLFHDTSTLKFGNVPISLNVAARKPAPPIGTRIG